MSGTTAPRPVDHTWSYAEQAAREVLWPLWQRISGLVAAGFAHMRQRQRRRRAARQLRTMDDRMLKDIGLTRSEIGSMVRHGRASRAAIEMERWS
jgi:uncharacterized protein YjiS (DUF1127 family)